MCIFVVLITEDFKHGLGIFLNIILNNPTNYKLDLMNDITQMCTTGNKILSYEYNLTIKFQISCCNKNIMNWKYVLSKFLMSFFPWQKIQVGLKTLMIAIKWMYCIHFVYIIMSLYKKRDDVGLMVAEVPWKNCNKHF